MRWAILAALASPALIGCGMGSNATATFKSPEPPAAKVHPRDEFKSRVLDRSPNEVKAAVGVPHHTTAVGSSDTWFYPDATTDPVTGKQDAEAQVVFRGGKAVQVIFAGR